MGWNPFKSEEVTQVATSVSRVISDVMLPNSVKSGLIKSVLRDTQVSSEILDDLASGIGVRAERMYRYGEAHYVNGLPSGEVYSSTQGRLQVEAVIEQQIEHQQVSVEYSHYGTLNALHIGWMKLIASHGYNPATNQLAGMSAAKGKTVYLKDMVVVVPRSQLGSTDAGRLVQWGTPACAGYTPARASNGTLGSLAAVTPVNVSDTATEIYLEVTGQWLASATTQAMDEDTFNITLSGYDLTANYFHAKYQVGTQIKYWLYRYGAGTYSTLDNVYVEAPAVNGSYFPFAYFRYNKQSTASDTSSQLYKTSKKMVKKLGMDFDTVADAIAENPDIGDIEQAMMILAVPAVSTNDQENQYLFDYFDGQHAAMDGTTYASEAAVTSALMNALGFGDWSGTANTTVIKDALFKMTLGNNGIYKRVVAGTIGAIGKYTSSYEPTTVSQTVLNWETGSNEVQTTEVKLHRYRHQITDGLYEEIIVSNLRMTYYVYGNYSTVGDETDSILLIPIDKTITETYSLQNREILYARSLHLVFNARVVTKVKWYQQEWFQIVMIVVAIVLTVIDMGSDGGSWIAAALELTGTEAIVATVIFNLVVGFVIMPKVFTLFVKAFGQQAAEIFAVVMIIYAVYTVGSTGRAGIPLASDLLMLSTGLERAVIQDKFLELKADYENLSQYEKEKDAELEKANALLQQQAVLNPIVIFGERPEDYFNRTVHYGNIGTLGINAITSYVDIALTLPKIQDTLGEELNDLST